MVFLRLKINKRNVYEDHGQADLRRIACGTCYELLKFDAQDDQP